MAASPWTPSTTVLHADLMEAWMGHVGGIIVPPFFLSPSFLQVAIPYARSHDPLIERPLVNTFFYASSNSLTYQSVNTAYHFGFIPPFILFLVSCLQTLSSPGKRRGLRNSE